MTDRVGQNHTLTNSVVNCFNLFDIFMYVSIVVVVVAVLVYILLLCSTLAM